MRSKKTFIFIIILLFILELLDFTTSRVLEFAHKKNQIGENGGKINFYLSNDDKYELVVLGNSRAKRHLIVDSLAERSYSLTHNGLNLDFHQALIHFLEEKGQLPDTIVLHLEPNEIWSNKFYKDVQHLKMYFYESDFVRASINKISKWERYKFFLKTYRFNGKSINIIANSLKSNITGSSDKGYELLPIDKRSFFIEDYDISIGETINNEYFEALDDIIELGKEKGIKIFFFTSPVYSFKKDGGVTKSTDILKDYMEGKNAIYFDFMSKKIPDFNSKDLWFDATHFNANGAILFTRTFRQEMNLL